MLLPAAKLGSVLPSLCSSSPESYSRSSLICRSGSFQPLLLLLWLWFLRTLGTRVQFRTLGGKAPGSPAAWSILGTVSSLQSVHARSLVKTALWCLEGHVGPLFLSTGP